VADRGAPCPELPPDRDDRHGLIVRANARVKSVGFTTNGAHDDAMRRDPVMAQLARELRRDETNAEKLVWEMLRARRLGGLKFRRQHVLGRYIADFVCLSARLVIEIDGHTHNDLESDAKRTADLERAGYRVIRFWNSYV